MRIKTNLIALAAVATFGAGGVLAQGIPSTPSSTPSSSSSSSSSTSTSSPSSPAAPAAPSNGSSGYLTQPDKASAAASATNAGDKFGTLDKDHDGMVSKAEARKDKDLKGQFDTLDGNKDGKLDQSEFAQFEVGSTSNQQKSTTSGK
ncbi:MAG TPA: hypothetical protein VFB36_10190 [Nevskiaceae bacterium]|nr:hypothetical protein [Nevskiaceae bacterium]